MPQVSGKVKIPDGKKIAVNIGCDFDAQAIWIGSFNLTSPAYMSRGEFGAEVAVPRLLKLFDKHRIFTTPIVHEEFQGIRITPNVYTTLGELDRFCEVMENIATKGLPA